MRQPSLTLIPILRRFLAAVLPAALLLAMPVMARTNQPAAKKNVLVFLDDDLRPELGCYGVDAIKSPSIDALASEGLLFARASCQQSLCAPSRISMMTGQYPDNTGICDLFAPLRRENKTAMTMPMHLQQHGYVTAAFGKVYHHRTDDKANWSELPKFPRSMYAESETVDSIKRREIEASQKGFRGVEHFAVTQGPATEKAEMQETKIVKMGYSLRNDRWRHTEWIQAGTKRVVAREFYDHQDTNTPSQNLANESDQ